MMGQALVSHKQNIFHYHPKTNKQRNIMQRKVRYKSITMRDMWLSILELLFGLWSQCRCQGFTSSVSLRRGVVVANTFRMHTALPPSRYQRKGLGCQQLQPKQSRGDVQ